VRARCVGVSVCRSVLLLLLLQLLGRACVQGACTLQAAVSKAQKHEGGGLEGAAAGEDSQVAGGTVPRLVPVRCPLTPLLPHPLTHPRLIPQSVQCG
jgi:hypothetical protein